MSYFNEDQRGGHWVTLKITLHDDVHRALLRLQQLCGHETVEETIWAALRLYQKAPQSQEPPHDA